MKNRGARTVAYTAATLLGAIGALVSLGTELATSDASVLDVLLWSALALLLFGSAAREWWFRDRALDRSRRIVERVGSGEVDAIAQGSSGEVDTIRRLRHAHPGLRLQDAHGLVRDHYRDGH